MIRDVACPVALHPEGFPRRIAVFEHPQAGVKLVTSGFSASLRPEQAAAQRLFDTSGLETRAALSLGVTTDIEPGQRWHFSLCRLAGPVREVWQHHSKGDDAQLLRFFWIALDDPTPQALDAPFDAAVSWIRGAL